MKKYDGLKKGRLVTTKEKEEERRKRAGVGERGVIEVGL